MAITLVTTASATDANSYVSLAEASGYFESTSFSSTWEGWSSPKKINALVEAARAVDERFEYRGGKNVSAQSLDFPRLHGRSGILEDSAGIPIVVKDAQCQMVWYQSANLDASSQGDRTLDRVRIEGLVEVEYSSDNKPRGQQLTAGGTLERIDSLLEPLITSGSGPNNFKFSKF